MSERRVPLIVSIVLAFALLAAVNRLTPGIVPAIVVLVLLYTALANADRVIALAAAGERGLARTFRPRPAHDLI